MSWQKRKTNGGDSSKIGKLVMVIGQFKPMTLCIENVSEQLSQLPFDPLVLKMSLQCVSKKLASHAVAPTLARGVTTNTYSAKQAALGRPISPHVEIYKFPVTAISSIANRFSAMGISAAFVGGSALALLGADVPALIYSAQNNIPLFAPISKALVAFPVSYHMLSGLRQSLWDYKPELINNVDGPTSSYALFVASGIITVGAAAYTIKAPEDKETDQ
ncbi:hypothetical protein CCR75_003362 [Bremia lactucae]|uniref:Uncharacterized protein n=1 Tax=Bremia lactucae TaxID=4779 RepID=A0A976ICK5_BRELC|nr:hypothetical protein CCR75_003362 [Bremia lactucae]